MSVEVCAGIGQQLELFGSAPALPARTSGLGAKRCGRGATPQTVRTFRAAKINPTGRRVCRFTFRVLARHRARLADGREIWQAACSLIEEYFELLGGFQTVRDRVVTAWGDALLHFTPEQIREAMHALAAVRNAHRGPGFHRRAFLCNVERFAELPRIGLWLDRAERTAKPPAVDPLQSAALRERLNSLVGRSEVRPVRAAQPAAAPVNRAAVLARHVAAAAAAGEFYAQVWRATPEHRRVAIAAALTKDFRAFIEDFDRACDPDGAAVAPLLLEWCAVEALRRGASGGDT